MDASNRSSFPDHRRRDKSGDNSWCNVLSEVVDRYVNGEQHQERNLAMKLEKYWLEDHRLREHVKELAEQNVSLQRELCSNGRELDSQEMINKHVTKLRIEQIRVMGVEIALRKEVESYKLQTDALRNENISLLSLLRGRDSRCLTTELDREIRNNVCCLQTRCILMLNESTNLCSKLLEYIKTPNYYNARVANTGLDGQFILDCDVKVQGFKRGCETLKRNLQKMSSGLQKKARSSSDDDDPTSEGTLRSELKAERLITTVLREKLHSKDLAIQQLQAEIATAVRGNNILKNEVQDTSDDLSCALHKLKDLELQMSKKEDKMKRLQSDLQDSRKQLIGLRDILPKITQERDLMWDEVKQYSEQKMVLDLKVDTLKKKVGILNEGIRLKECHIRILKDSLDRRPFSLIDI